MSPTVDAVLRSWPFDPWLLAALLLTATVYFRGWRALRRRDLGHWPIRRLLFFLGGLSVVFLALGSPIEPFAALLLLVHMLQHLLLMMVAPPLLWLGAPFFPLLRGLPQPIRAYWVLPLLRWPPLRKLGERLTHPVGAWLLFVAATWLWHAPPLYELALGSPGWHRVQHATFLGTGLLFWYTALRPYPARPRWSAWLLLPYFLLADGQNTALAALLTFSDRVLYPHYAQVPRLGGLSALDDQSAAGVIMWVPGSLAFLIPLFWIGIQLFFGTEVRKPVRAVPARGRIPLPLANPAPAAPASSFNLLCVPLLGRFLRWRHARLAMQLPLLVLAGLIVWDGLRGPQVGPMNLAGVLPWIHWRGLLIVGLLAAGNFFCTACPFVLPRTLARRWLPAGRSWPRRLRNKWPALLLLALFLWAYEAFALWASPWWTAWLIVGYFAGAFLVDAVFRGGAFCKYVCPIGQFNFVQSLMSPLTVKVREPAVCAACRTKDCLHGRDGIPGCELRLFLPRKAGNMDCTFCLDCVHACPHENIGIVATTPGADLPWDGSRSGVGRWSKRRDLAALVAVLVFAAFANAAGMVAPVVTGQDNLVSWLGLRSPLLIISAGYFVALVVLPLAGLGGSAALSRWWGRLEASMGDVACRFVYALVPLGCAMWLAHYSFHFLTSWDTAVPVAQRFTADMGMSFVSSPEWNSSCCTPVAGWLLRLEIVMLDVGLLLSLYTAYRIALAEASGMRAALKALAPWAVLLVLLFALGVWIVFQPMQMRGTMMG
jgi:cytochrome c oxidase assembly factor CtaG